MSNELMTETSAKRQCIEYCYKLQNLVSKKLRPI
jgi:hypothetical protein